MDIDISPSLMARISKEYPKRQEGGKCQVTLNFIQDNKFKMKYAFLVKPKIRFQ